MENEKKRNLLLIIIVAAFLAVLALTLGLVFGLKNFDDDKNEINEIRNNEEDVEIVNSYDNTEELSEKFPVTNNVTILDGIEKIFKIVY